MLSKLGLISSVWPKMWKTEYRLQPLKKKLPSRISQDKPKEAAVAVKMFKIQSPAKCFGCEKATCIKSLLSGSVVNVLFVSLWLTTKNLQFLFTTLIHFYPQNLFRALPTSLFPAFLCCCSCWPSQASRAFGSSWRGEWHFCVRVNSDTLSCWQLISPSCQMLWTGVFAAKEMLQKWCGCSRLS